MNKNDKFKVTMSEGGGFSVIFEHDKNVKL